MNQELGKAIVENAVFVMQFLGIVAVMFVIAWMAERIIRKKNGDKEPILSTRKITVIGIFSAIAAVLYIFDFPLPLIPEFYKLDFSELPALVGAFAFGPVAGVMIEFCKMILKILTKGTTTAFVGDLANFMIGCSFLLPASIIYTFRKNRKTAAVGCVAGTVLITAFGTFLNGVYLIPVFVGLFFHDAKNPEGELLKIAAAINPSIDSVETLALLGAGPLNLIKGIVISLITLLVYKKLSPLLKAGNGKQNQGKQEQTKK